MALGSVRVLGPSRSSCHSAKHMVRKAKGLQGMVLSSSTMAQASDVQHFSSTQEASPGQTRPTNRRAQWGRVGRAVA